MPPVQFKFSRHICLQTTEHDKATSFYCDVMGLPEVHYTEGHPELDAKPMRFFLDTGEQLGPILEFFVKDVVEARDYLLKLGCKALVWEGAGGRCYIQD